MCSFNRGNIEGTNSSKICVWCLCMYILCLRIDWFCRLTWLRVDIYIWKKSLEMCICLWPEFDCPEVTLCVWQDIKIQLLLLLLSSFIVFLWSEWFCCLFLWREYSCCLCSCGASVLVLCFCGASILVVFVLAERVFLFFVFVERVFLLSWSDYPRGFLGFFVVVLVERVFLLFVFRVASAHVVCVLVERMLLLSRCSFTDDENRPIRCNKWGKLQLFSLLNQTQKSHHTNDQSARQVYKSKLMVVRS